MLLESDSFLAHLQRDLDTALRSLKSDPRFSNEGDAVRSKLSAFADAAQDKMDEAVRIYHSSLSISEKLDPLSFQSTAVKNAQARLKEAHERIIATITTF